MSETSLSKQFSSESLVRLPSDLAALCDHLLIGPGRSGDSASELLIRSSRVSLYLLGIATILEFPFVFLIAYLTTRFLRIVTIRF